MGSQTSPGLFVARFSAVTGLDLQSLQRTYRVLRSRGYVNKSGRGRSAVHVTLQDASTFLVAASARACGHTAEEAANCTLDPGRANAAAAALTAGLEYVFVAVTDEVAVSSTISGKAIASIMQCIPDAIEA